MPHIQMELLERRFLLALTPAAPRAATLGTAFDRGERQVLLQRLTNLDPATRSHLQARLSSGPGKFDISLLAYMRSRSGPNFFHDRAKTEEIGGFIIANKINYADLQTRGDALTAHLFPDQYSSADFTVQLPKRINWVSPGDHDNPEFLHSMNRQEWWRELAWINAINPHPKYNAELQYELASWSHRLQHPQRNDRAAPSLRDLGAAPWLGHLRSPCLAPARKKKNPDPFGPDSFMKMREAP